MEYISTRNNKKTFEFKDVFIKGLADDGGLFIPKSLHKIDINELRGLEYKDLAKKVIYPFIGSFMSEKDLDKIIDQSYSVFRKKNVIDLIKVGDRSVLELFHGPTLAFKDIAMQLLGNFYEYYLNNQNEKLNIVVATSGDTGAAAIDAIKGKSNVNIFVLHPHNRVSSVQRKLMTTGKDKNVFNIAVNGNFDDCQNLVKTMFADKNFSNDIKMSGVNSINWARIIAQSVYYFYSYFLIEDDNRPINFSVPTGNFGDVYAGYLAKKMGLPINKLIVATNQNDILHRAISNGGYEVENVFETLSPSMDIQVASNFERLLYDFYAERDSSICDQFYRNFPKSPINLEKNMWEKSKDLFMSYSVDDISTVKAMKDTYVSYNYLIDPHTAVAIEAVDQINEKLNGNTLILSTAHPAKFPEIIKDAGLELSEIPKTLLDVYNLKERATYMPASKELIFDFIIKNNL